jgi:hypothetical protein
MDGLLSRLTNEDLLALSGLLLGLVAILGGLSIGLVSVVTYHFRRSRKDDIEATLKMEMLERGMSAEEIQTVLAARADGCASPQSAIITGARLWRDLRRDLARST